MALYYSPSDEELARMMLPFMRETALAGAAEGIAPILQMGMAFDELAVNRAAVDFARQYTTFDSAGVAGRINANTRRSRLGAILLGGAAGVFVGPDQLSMPLTFEGTRAAGATLGSGVALVYDDRADLGDALLRIAEFFRHESCGQCVPCRVGTVRQEELLHRLRSRPSRDDRAAELALFQELAQGMRDASICGLGQTASAAIESAFERFDPFPRPAPR